MNGKTRNCDNCGKEYEKNYRYSSTQWSLSKTCSYKCASAVKKRRADELWEKKPKTKVCPVCGSDFERIRTYSPSQWAAAKYCSIKCFSSTTRKHRNSKEKGVAYRRRNGMVEQGTEEFKKKISDLTSLAMKRPEIQLKLHAQRQPLTISHKKKLSDAHAGKMPKNMQRGFSGGSGSYTHVKRGEYDINGSSLYFRSMWEANYALFLDFLIERGEILDWEYEPETFVFDAIQFGTRSYTPDFKVTDKKGRVEYHEVKGYMDSKSKTKLKRMAKYYPEITIKLIDGPEYRLLKKQIGKICKFYE